MPMLLYKDERAGREWPAADKARPALQPLYGRQVLSTFSGHSCHGASICLGVACKKKQSKRSRIRNRMSTDGFLDASGGREAEKGGGERDGERGLSNAGIYIFDK